tara:strand:+ start:640 stop:951 length:312 start_codon:yes stop_codon:yes gene_type:complete
LARLYGEKIKLFISNKEHPFEHPLKTKALKIKRLTGLKVLEAGIEPALPKELDFESSASTSSATRAIKPPSGNLGSGCKVIEFIEMPKPFLGNIFFIENPRFG